MCRRFVHAGHEHPVWMPPDEWGGAAEDEEVPARSDATTRVRFGVARDRGAENGGGETWA